ncbi:MAG: MFS transporter [Conexivisphaerales archaeon]
MGTALDAGTKGLRTVNSAIIALSSGWVMIYADRLSISPVLNLIRQQFGLTFSGVSLVVSVYFLAYVGLTIPATIAAERWGYRKVMVSFFLLAAFSLGAAGVLGYSYYLLVLFMGLHGVGAGAYYPTAYRISNAMVTNKSRGLISSLINSGMGFGTIAGLLIAGPVLKLFASWQTMLILLSFPTMLVAFLLWKTTNEIPNERKKNDKITQFYSVLLKNKSFVMLCAAMFCSLYGYWVILTWGPAFLQESRGLSILYSGAATAIFSAIAIPSSITISHFSDRLGRKRIAMVILPLAALTIFFMARSYSLLEVLLAIAGYGVIGKLTLDPIVIAWVGELVPQEQIGSALAMLNVAAMSSSILAPLITGLIADFTNSLAVGFYLGAAIVLLGFLFSAFAKETEKNAL